MTHVLILGGTAEARRLADRLARHSGLRLTYSLAGRTAAPAPQAGEIRTGGFGGADGLAAWLETHAVAVLVDATHPFAARISQNSAEAARRAGVPLLRLARPPWPRLPGDDWTEVASLDEAAAALGPVPRSVFLAIGRQEVARFRAAPQHAYTVRSIEPIDPAALPGADTILARGPFAEAGEIDLLRSHAIDVLVTKNSGGDATYAKIAAARALGLPVVMVRRAADPDALTPDEIMTRIAHLAAPAAKRGV